jgi:HlyD family secretion protein
MKVKEGDVLARLDDSENKAALELAEANLNAARIATEQTKVQLDLAEKTLHRVVVLANTKVETAAGLDQAAANLNSLKAQLHQQEAQILVAERQVAVFEQQAQEMIIRAPFSGVVTTKDAQPGEMISPLATGAGFSRTGICTIVDVDSLEIEIEVNQNHLGKVTPGQSVIATLDAYPDWQIPATVLAIIPTADRNKGTVKVRIGLKNRDERILPQMEVRAAFLDTSQKAAGRHGILVPRIAVRDINGSNFVWIVKDGRVERRTITVGDNVGDQVLVSAGLNAGEMVVINSQGDLSEGTRVKQLEP